MTELSVRPDPAVWSMVPAPEHADAWLHAKLDHLPADQQTRTLDAAILALRAQLEMDASFVLLLDVAEGMVLASLAVFAYDDIPAPAGAEEAERVARAMIPSTWESAVLDVQLGANPGWRVTVFDDGEPARETTSAEPAGTTVTIATLVWTAYVLDVSGRAVIALLPPLSPEAAFIAQHHTERALATLAAEAA
jgi:hypothetical protein